MGGTERGRNTVTVTTEDMKKGISELNINLQNAELFLKKMRDIMKESSELPWYNLIGKVRLQRIAMKYSRLVDKELETIFRELKC